MTKQIGRRAFLGGAVVVGFSFAATMAGVGHAEAATSGSGGDIENAWLVVRAAHGGGTGTSITVYSPKVELGTGTQTALSQIVAEELYADIRQLSWVQGDTNFDPAADPNSQGYTAGSQTVQVEGPTLRLAAAAAFQALQALAVSYFGTASPAWLKAADGVFFYGRKKASDDQVLVGQPGSAFANAPQQATATYFTPFQMHGSLAASAAVAEWDGQTLTVYSGTQGPGPLQSAIGGLLNRYDPDFSGKVHIIYTEQAGCYGHDGADDCSAEAALIAYQRGGAVKVQWSRADEHHWEPLGPAMVHQMQGGIANGSVVSWQHDVYSPTHNSRPGGGPAAGNLLVAQYLGVSPAPMPPLGPNTATRNAPVNYAFPNSRTGRHFVTSFQLQSGSLNASSPLTWVLPRSTALRSLGGFSNSFANESFMDKLAHLADSNLANDDPLALQFRLSYLSADARAVAVLQAVAGMPDGPVPASASGHATGRGLAFIRYENGLTYVATIADVDVDLSTGQVGHRCVRRPRLRPGDQPRRVAEPDPGQRYPGHQPYLVRGSRLQRRPSHAKRLAELRIIGRLSGNRIRPGSKHNCPAHRSP